jgi:uncharacterized linocin/CFP29 family protein
MTELLARDDAPLGESEWAAIDNVVVQAATRQLVARRFISAFGPLGAGLQDVIFDTFGGIDEAAVDMLGRGEAQAIEPLERRHQNLPMIYKDFVLFWRDIESARRIGLPLDVSAAAAASAFVAQKEDDLVFNGDPNLGIAGLMTVTGRNKVETHNWDDAGGAFEDVVAAIQKLTNAGFFGPYAVAVSPRRFAQMHRVYANTGVLEINHIRDVATAGVYQAPSIMDYGVVVSTGVQNLDIAIAQDFVTGYLGPVNLNHPFRVMESVSLRIKRPGAICTLESGK